MFVTTKVIENQYTRHSKNGLEHTYKRNKIIAVLQCDNCDSTFERDLKQIDRKRLSNRYFHVCSKCDAKKFAQSKGVERKKIWDMPASSMLPIGRY